MVPPYPTLYLAWFQFIEDSAASWKPLSFSEGKEYENRKLKSTYTYLLLKWPERLPKLLVEVVYMVKSF